MNNTEAKDVNKPENEQKYSDHIHIEPYYGKHDHILVRKCVTIKDVISEDLHMKMW